MYSYGSPHMAVQKQDDQHEHIFSSYVRIRDVVLKTYLGRWTIGRSGERGSGMCYQRDMMMMMMTPHVVNQMLRVQGGEGCLLIYGLVTSFKAEKRKVNVGGCMVSSFIPPSLSLSFRLGILVCRVVYRLPSFNLTSLSRNLSFISFFFSDLIKLGLLYFLLFFFVVFFLLPRSRIGRKITFNYYFFFFFDKFNRRFATRWSYAQKPLVPFWRKS